MSAIDQYNHKCIGVVDCPSPYPIVFGSDTRSVLLYRLDEDASHNPEWDAKKGDIVLGGGSGEAATLRIAIPEAIPFFTNDDWDDFETLSNLYKACWDMTQAYVFGAGYVSLGWNPAVPIEAWLAENIVAYILREYPQDYLSYSGSVELEQAGTICRSLTATEASLLAGNPDP